MKSRICILLLVTLLFSCIREKEIQVPEFDFEQKAFLNLNCKNVNDTIKIQSWHWNSIPGEESKSDTLVVFENGFMLILVNVIKPKLVKFYFNNKRFDFFFVPGDTTFVEIDFSVNIDSILLAFNGKLASINQYHLAKYKRFQSWDYYIPRAGFTQSSLTAVDLVSNNDRQTKLELDFLNNYALNNTLPQWFQDYEKQNIIITSGYFKLNSIFYREFMLGIIDTIPDGYYRFVDSIDIHDETSIITEYYFYYLSDLMSHQRSLREIEIDSLNKRDKIKGDFSHIYEFVSELNSLAQELYSLYYYYFIAKHKPEYTELLDSLAQNIITTEYIDLIDSIGIAQYKIPKHVSAPGFYLQDTEGDFRKLKEFKGKVVLLNFWSTNCIPCLKEFPYEDSLVERFRSEDFQLINICLNSSEDNWRRKIQGHNTPLHLYAKESWCDILKESYKIYGVPSFVLINKDGQIINPNAPKPSSDDLIPEIDKALQSDNVE